VSPAKMPPFSPHPLLEAGRKNSVAHSLTWIPFKSLVPAHSSSVILGFSYCPLTFERCYQKTQCLAGLNALLEADVEKGGTIRSFTGWINYQWYSKQCIMEWESRVYLWFLLPPWHPHQGIANTFICGSLAKSTCLFRTQGISCPVGSGNWITQARPPGLEERHPCWVTCPSAQEQMQWDTHIRIVPTPMCSQHPWPCGCKSKCAILRLLHSSPMASLPVQGLLQSPAPWQGAPWHLGSAHH
jgi:hypothetical protein